MVSNFLYSPARSLKRQSPWIRPTYIAPAESGERLKLLLV